MRILITGGAGFIGSHIVDMCIHRGDEVCVIDNLSTGQRSNLIDHIVQKKITFHTLDICESQAVEKIFQDFRPEVVFHLAAQINVRTGIEKPKFDAEVNILGSLTILEAMRKSGCPRIIFSSTGGALFSGGTPPYSESDTPSPDTPYGISKLTVERFLNFYDRHYGIVSTILRYSNVYGPRQNARGEAGVVTLFLDKIQQKITPTIFGDGTQTRDFISVFDIVSANFHVLDKHLTGIFHVGTGIEISVNQLWEMLAGLTKIALIPQYGASLGEILHTSLDASRLISTGWSPAVSFSQGIASLADGV